jgi:hypothetical protein
MPLKPNMTLEEAKEFLQGDLKRSIENDIRPILQPEKEEGGYFGVPRSVLCYVDFLGALYCGYQGEKFRNGKKRIAISWKACRFIREILGSVDSLYEDNGDLLYEMYRHGTVHLFSPNELKGRDGRVISWLLHKQGRQASIPVDGEHLEVRHLQPVEFKGCHRLPVSIVCLCDDLNAAIDELRGRLDDRPVLLRRWNSAAAALCEPETTKLNWSTECSACPPPSGQRP